MQIMMSYNWIKEYLHTKLSAEQFAACTTNIGNSVEYLHDLKKEFASMVVGQVLEIKSHPNADKLRIAVTDIGKKKVQIVCGGVNLAQGMKVAVALVGASVRWHGQGEPVILQETEVRGVKSEGMICAANELGFEKLPQGEKDIWDLTTITDANPGTALAKALGLEDVLFDIEVTSNRPDCKSVIGQAREGHAVTGEPFAFKPVALPKPKLKSALCVTVKEAGLCPSYQAIVLDGVKVGPSPWWLQKRLLLAGHRPINNVVDVTNYVLHEYGQPLHAFDADSLEGEQIIVRRAKKGEKLLALDGKEYTLQENMLVIADGKKPVAIAGVMGGEATGASSRTTRVVLECAAFDPVSIRRTARALNLYSDASTLYEKGLSTQALAPALARAVELLREVAGAGAVSKPVVVQAKKYRALSFAFDPARAAQLIGAEIPKQRMMEILGRLGFIKKSGKAKNVSLIEVPYWRDHDIEDSVDFVEEIARVYGFDRIPAVLPAGMLPCLRQDPLIVWERRIKECLRGAGLTEVYAYSFMSEKQLVAYAIAPSQAVRLTNPLSVEDEFMRPALAPSMLTVIAQNQRACAEGILFEIAPVWEPKSADVPRQRMALLIAVFGSDGAEGFRKAKGMVERLSCEMAHETLSVTDQRPSSGRWHSTRSGSIQANKTQNVGAIGQIAPDVAQAFGLEPVVVLVELDLDALIPLLSIAKSYVSVPIFPDVKRDLAFVLDDRASFSTIERTIFEGSELLTRVELFDVYRGKGVEEGKKSLAVHLTFRAKDRTLSNEEAEKELTHIRARLADTFSATMRS